MVGFLKFWGKSQKTAAPAAVEKPKKKLVEDRKISKDEAVAIVLKKYPLAEMNEMGRDKSSLWTIKVAPGTNEFLCGWALNEEAAWVEAAKRILGISRFAKTN